MDREGLRKERDALERRAEALQQVRALGQRGCWLRCVPCEMQWCKALLKALVKPGTAVEASLIPQRTLRFVSLLPRPQELGVRKASLDDREQRIIAAESDLKLARTEHERVGA